MILEKRWHLVQMLIQKTQQKKLNWENGPSASMLYCSMKGLGIAIRPSGDDLVISLFNEDGEMVESISDPDFTNAGFANSFATMSALYELAKAEATGSEKVVDSLLDILRDIN